MAEFIRIDRRIFLARFSKGALAMAVLGACADDSSSTTRAASTTSGTTATSASAASSTSASGPSSTAGASSTTGAAGAAGAAEFVRIPIDFVSAYLVVRGSEAAVVDTGVTGSEGSIEAALGNVGLDWAAVGHVILTHHHPDHVGSLSAVMDAAAQATGYIGEGDMDKVSGPRELMALAEGNQVFGLEVIGTPGHTVGHISLFDSAASVLVAGDALNGGGSGVEGPNPQFSEDHQQALATVGKMAGVEYETLYFGHGDPVMSGPSGLVAELAATL
ncbi:MAG: MBL fold metallo-hydrolase [Acidimicrobiia bacterium]